MILVIAEKPELGKSIALAISKKENKKVISQKQYLEVGYYKITWAFGHLLKLKEFEEYNQNYKIWKLEDLPIYFENWEHEEDIGKGKEYKKNQLTIIKKLLKEADLVIHAGDPDDEGQYLIDEILQFYKFKKSVKRILINDNNEDYILKQLDKIDDNNKYTNLGKAAYARAISDNIFGKNLTRYFTIKSGTLLKIGRVQTPTLGLVINRDYEIENHVKSNYFTVSIYDNNKLKLKYTPKNKIEDKSISLKLKEKIKENVKIINISVEKKEIIQKPPLPYNLAKLQSEANKKFGYSPKKVLDITQSLRENYKAITYNRSDCQYLGMENYKEANIVILSVIKNLNIQDIGFDIKIKSDAFDDTKITAHHAIIPTKNNIDISKLTKEEFNIYNLICTRYLIQFLKPVKYMHTLLKSNEVNISGYEENIIFKNSSKMLLEKGYLDFYKGEKEDEKEDEEESNFLIDNLKSDFKYYLSEVSLIEKETKPKSRYTEGTLLEDMTTVAKYVKDENIKKIMKEKDKDKKGESGSIGTPATRSTIIENLIKSGYLERKGKTIISTKLAREFYNKLPYSAKSIDNTALWWLIQEDIKKGNAKVEDLTLMVLKNIKEIIENKKDFKLSESLNSNENKEIKEIKNKKDDIICPCCNKILKENDKYFKCNCEFIFWKEAFIMGYKIKLTDKQCREFLSNKKVLVSKLKNKAGKDYSAYFKFSFKNNKGNFELIEFANKNEKK